MNYWSQELKPLQLASEFENEKAKRKTRKEKQETISQTLIRDLIIMAPPLPSKPCTHTLGSQKLNIDQRHVLELKIWLIWACLKITRIQREPSKKIR